LKVDINAVKAEKETINSLIKKINNSYFILFNKLELSNENK